jgi:hypothetical protein
MCEVQTMTGTFYPLLATLWIAGLVQTALAGSKLRLFQNSITPTINTTIAELEAAEADFSGYSEKTITAFLAPYLGVTGANINSPLLQFDSATPFSVSNSIGGAWIEDSTGDLVSVITFPEPVAMGAVGQSLPVSQVLSFGTGQ